MSKHPPDTDPASRYDAFAIDADGTIVKNNDLTSWKAQLIRGKKGNLEPESIANAILIIQHAPQYKGVFVHDQFADEIIVHRCPPWENESDFKVHRLDDNDIVRCAAALEYVGLSPSTTRVTQAIEVAARNSGMHPVREYLDSLVWDGDDRLHSWLQKYANATIQPWEYVGPIGVKWMVAAVRRVYFPGTKFDHMLVLEGEQNIGKSRLLRTIATFGPLEGQKGEEREYFTDAIRFETINDLASIMALQGKLIVEFSELAGMSRKEIEEVKNWITIEKDEVQKKYKNTITRYPRQFVLAGTTNEDTWLRDATGNRRFLPIKCAPGKFDIEGLRAVREQLWAEAVWRHKAGEEIMIDRGSELEALAATEQASRMIEDVWTNQILDSIKLTYEVTTSECLGMLSVETGRRDELSARRVARILKAHGWQQKQKWVNGRNVRMWENPDHKRIVPENYSMTLDVPSEEDGQ